MLRLIACELKNTIPVQKIGDEVRDLPETMSPADLIDGMVAAVSALHAAGIIHRNITHTSFKLRNQNLGVVLGNFEHAIFNLGMRNFESDVLNEFNYPIWGPKDPGLPAGDRILYGADYDVYCLGLCIAAVLYPGVPVAQIDYTVPLDMPNEWTYRIIARGALHLDPASRFSAYAMRNMCDVPSVKLWLPVPPVEPIWYGKLIPETYVKYIHLLFGDPKLFLRSIIDDADAAPYQTSLSQRQLQKIITWIGDYKWDPSLLYVAYILSQRSHSDTHVKIDHTLVDGDIDVLTQRLISKIST